MKKYCLFLVVLIGLSYSNIQAGEDKWVALIRYAGVEPAQIEKVCQHFPSIDKYIPGKEEEFTEKRIKWMEKYPLEVELFLKMDGIKKLNPSLSDLGIQAEGTERNVFEHPYWNWVQASGITKDELNSVSAHFPLPKHSSDIQKDILIYDAAVSDWMRLFPVELRALMNHPKLLSVNRGMTKGFDLVAPEGTDAFRSLILENNAKPEISQFDSGNPELDKIRYEMYVKAWFYQFDKLEFYKQYQPDQYEEYKQAIETNPSKPEYNK